jgi:U4/U6.U5 tri-snRNP-associated protein 3
MSYRDRDSRSSGDRDIRSNVCFDFQKGRCDRGSSCRFDHVEGSGSKREFSRDGDRDRYRDSRSYGDSRSNICYDFQKGRCDRGSSCRFSHDGENEDRNRGSYDRDRDRRRDRSPKRDRDNDGMSHLTIDKSKLSKAALEEIKLERIAMVKRITDESNGGEDEKDDNEEGDNGECDEDEMMRILGFGNFDSTKGKPVAANQEGVAAGGVAKAKGREYRQYMNRRGGFNRELDKI